MTELITPLWYWSQLDHATMDLHLAVGQALAYAMGGNAPLPSVCMALQARVDLVSARLREATTLGCSREGEKQDMAISHAQLVFKFCELGSLDREKILRDLGLVETEDKNLEDAERWGLAFKRAVDQGKYEALQDAILAKAAAR